jgi:hypothetical protein
MTRGAISKLADRLIAKSLLVALADANDADFFDHLAPQNRATLFRILRGIVEKRGLKSLPVE